MIQLFNVLRVNMHNLALALNGAPDEQERTQSRRSTESLKHILPDDDVGNPGFIFQRDERDSGRGARPLAAKNQPGDTHFPALRAMLRRAKFRSAQRTEPAQNTAKK